MRALSAYQRSHYLRAVRSELASHEQRVSEYIKIRYRYFPIAEIRRLLDEDRLPPVVLDYFIRRFRNSLGYAKDSDEAVRQLSELVPPREIAPHKTGLPRGRHRGWTALAEGII